MLMGERWKNVSETIIANSGFDTTQEGALPKGFNIVCVCVPVSMCW